jgi:hypothetical protein
MRIYHPDYPLSWGDRVWDLFAGRKAPAPREGIDYTLMNRAAARVVRDFLDQTLNMTLLGDEMVRVDSAWELPESEAARETAASSLVVRLRFGQVHPGGMRMPIAARWYQFDPANHGTRVLIRLLERPNPGLRSFLAGNLEESGDKWTEYAVGGD